MNVVIAGGILFVAVGVCNLIIFGQSSRETRGVARLFNQISNTAAIVLGICMLVFQHTFTPLVPFIFGLLVAVCSLWQFFLLAIGARPYQMPAWHYIFPVVIAGIAVYIFTQETSDESAIVLATGIALALLGTACVIEGSALGMQRRKAAKAAIEAQAAATAPEAPKADEAPVSSPETHSENA